MRLKKTSQTSDETSRTLEIVQWSRKNKCLKSTNKTKTCKQFSQWVPAKHAVLSKMKHVAWVKRTHGLMRSRFHKIECARSQCQTKLPKIGCMIRSCKWEQTGRQKHSVVDRFSAETSAATTPHKFYSQLRGSCWGLWERVGLVKSLRTWKETNN